LHAWCIALGERVSSAFFDEQIFIQAGQGDGDSDRALSIPDSEIRSFKMNA
jgi:hypothetical protein